MQYQWKRSPRLWIGSLLFWGVLCNLSTAQSDSPRRLALVVGISDYFHKNMDDLKFAEKDAVDVGRALEKLGFEVTEVTGRSATRAKVEHQIDAFLAETEQLEPESIVFIMFSGHGQQLRVTEKDERTGEFLAEVPFFCPRDAIPLDPLRNNIRGKSAEQVAEELKLISLNRLIANIDERSNSLNNLLVIDACRNNPAKGKAPGITGSAARELPRGISILFAAKSGQKSWESTDPKVEQGVMTHYLLKGMSGAARNSRRELTWSRLVTYVREEVEFEGWKLAGGRGFVQNPHTLMNSEESVFLYTPSYRRNRRSAAAAWLRLWEKERQKEDPRSTGLAVEAISRMDVGPGDWPMWGGWPGRNNTPFARNIPSSWNIETGENIKWVAEIGSANKAVPVIANGKVFVGANNAAGRIERYPSELDLGVLFCLDEQTGGILWHYAARKMEVGRVHDWPIQGIMSSPYADGDRIWFVDNRFRVICADAEGFLDGENDGPFQEEEYSTSDDADVIWRFDMMSELGIFPHNKATCSPVCVGDRLFLITGNGVDVAHLDVPAPRAPSFICLDKNTGELLWEDNSPGANILHGQWASPSAIEVNGASQVLFPGGDGWLYSFSPEGELLWKFDTNPKTSKWILGGRGDRNNIIGMPVYYDGRVYIANGQDPEHDEGPGHLWCLDPTRRGDISPTLAMKKVNAKNIAPRRVQSVDAEKGEFEGDNPNSGLLWHWSASSEEFEDTYHRMLGSVVVHNDIVYSADITGLFHTFDAVTGEHLAVYDLFAYSWASPLVTNGKVYQPDEDGEVLVTPLFKRNASEIEVLDEVLSDPDYRATLVSPVVANHVLYITSDKRLFAIEQGAQTDPRLLKVRRR